MTVGEFMIEVEVNGKKIFVSEELEKGEMELDLMNHELLEDTMDLSDALVEVANSLEDTMSDMEIVDYE